MKELSRADLLVAPAEIQRFWHRGLFPNAMIGASEYERILNTYPEYFPEEVEHRRKYALIPQEVHDAYYKELFDGMAEIDKDRPPRLGIREYCSNKEHRDLVDEHNERTRPLHKELEERLYQKHYAKYLDRIIKP